MSAGLPVDENARTLPERLRHAYVESRYVSAVVLPVVVFSWLVTGPEIESRRFLAWGAALAVAYGLRLAIDRLFFRFGAAPGAAPRWLRVLCASNALNGAAWSVLSWHVVAHAPPQVQFGGAIVLIGAAAVGLRAYAVVPSAYAALLLAIMLPTVAATLARGEPGHVVLATSLAIFSAVMLGIGVRMRQDFIRRAVLQEDLAETLRRYAHATERLNRSMEAGSTMLWEADLAEGTAYVSEGWTTLVGGPPGPARTTIAALAAVTHPEDMPSVSAQQAAVLRGERESYESEQRVRGADGRWHWVVSRGRVSARDPASGRALRMSGTTRDITVRKAALLALEDSERRYRALAADLEHQVEARTRDLREREAMLALVTENVPIKIGYYDAGDVLRFANRRYAQALGRERVDEVVGRPIGELIPEGRLREHAPYLERVQRGEVVEFEKESLWLTGRVHHAILVPDIGEHGRLQGTFAVLIDITERRALEEQLRESQKMEAVGTLAGGIAHDFNNILGVILGNVGLARKDAAGQEKVLASLEEIARAGEQAKRLVQQILAFSRRQPQEMKVRELGPVVREALGLLRAMVPAVVTLEERLGEEAVYARVDETQVGQVLMNLCTNAWQAMGGSTGRIGVELRAGELGEAQAKGLGIAPGRYARLGVEDDGPGMDEATQARIFEPFFTTKAGKGTGLGLAVVHGIVKGHGGAIEVHSAPGRGTRFEVWLPAVQAPRAMADAAAVAPTSTPMPTFEGRGRHVMYVDDNAAMVLLVERMLEGEGYRVSGFEGAHAALAALQEDPGAVDLVVTDYNMPGMSGLELAHEVERVRPGLPVVVASGFVTEELKAYAAAVGVRHVIHKPDTFDELGRAIQRLAGEAGRRPS